MTIEECVQKFKSGMMQLGLNHEVQWILDEAQKLQYKETELGAYLGEVLERRKADEPLAYIFGHWAFRNLELNVGKGVLIPRPETEELVDHVLDFVLSREKNFGHWTFVDAGAGSGCLGLGVWDELCRKNSFIQHTSSFVFIEKSEEAQPYLQQNIERYCPQAQVFASSWLDWVPQGPIQVLLSNPPYIARTLEDDAETSVKSFEPHAALYPEDLERFADATGPYRELIRLAQHSVDLGGLAAFELGPSQAPWIESFVKENYPCWSGDLRKDMSGKDRFYIMERRA